MADRDSLVKDFSNITGVGDERARFFLELSAWKLDVALSSYYENEGEDAPFQETRAQVDEEGVQRSNVENVPGQNSDSKPKSRPGAPFGSRFATVASLSQNDGSSDDDDDEGQAFYAGGSEHSGQQILGPSKKRKDIVSEMFKSVQEHGAEVVDPRQVSAKKSSNFGGVGYRLGQSTDDTEVLAPAPSGSREREVTLRMWKEGFSIDGGQMRLYSDPDNKDFLESIRRGEVPGELINEARGREIHLNMEDHRHENFVPSKTKLRAFTGKGHVLGSPTPTAIGTTKPLDEADKDANEEAARQAVPLAPGEPSTTIQIRLADGSRLVGQFNHSRTVADVRRYISVARPQYEHQGYMLLTTFPSKELSDGSQTLQDAGVLNSALLQRLL